MLIQLVYTKLHGFDIRVWSQCSLHMVVPSLPLLREVFGHVWLPPGIICSTIIGMGTLSRIGRRCLGSYAVFSRVRVFFFFQHCIVVLYCNIVFGYPFLSTGCTFLTTRVYLLSMGAIRYIFIFFAYTNISKRTNALLSLNDAFHKIERLQFGYSSAQLFLLYVYDWQILKN